MFPTPLFSFVFANFPTPPLAAALLFLAGLALCSGRLVVDVFRDDSPAQSPKRPVPWNVGVAFAIFVSGAILFPLLAATAVASLPTSWFPDFATVRSVENADAPSDVAQEVGEQNNDAPREIVKQNDDGPREIGEKNNDDAKLATQHPVARLLVRSRSTPWALETFLLCLFVAVVAAPFAEEFLFRTLFQGTLENIALEAVLPPPGTPRRPLADATAPADEDAFRWTDPTTPLERNAFCLRSAFAILVPAFVFGLIHAGAPETPEEARDPETLNRLFRTMLAAGIANVATLLVGLFVLRRFTGATTGDVGLGPEFTYKAGRFFASLRRFGLDFYRGVVAFLFIAPIVFSANAGLRVLFPNSIVDPIPIFLFALAEGVVYWRIRRYATVVGMHVALNATSFLLLCAQF